MIDELRKSAEVLNGVENYLTLSNDLLLSSPYNSDAQITCLEKITQIVTHLDAIQTIANDIIHYKTVLKEEKLSLTPADTKRPQTSEGQNLNIVSNEPTTSYSPQKQSSSEIDARTLKWLNELLEQQQLTIGKASK